MTSCMSLRLATGLRTLASSHAPVRTLFQKTSRVAAVRGMRLLSMRPLSQLPSTTPSACSLLAQTPRRFYAAAGPVYPLEHMRNVAIIGECLFCVCLFFACGAQVG
jgi:hypothetical protein